ncbi:glycoside hydrolase family 13 protein [Scleroderma citrinum]
MAEPVVPTAAPDLSSPRLSHPPESTPIDAISKNLWKQFFSGERSEGEEPIHVYELKLDQDGGPSKKRSYVRLPPPYTPYVLRIYLEAGTPASKNGVFKTDLPLDDGVVDRNRFVERMLPVDLTKPIHIDLPISHAGTFVYWVEYDGDAGERIKGREGYFNIDPILRIHARSPILSPESKPLLPSEGGAKILPELVNLPMDGLAILTVVSKWMGPISQWRKHFEEASDRGYTMLHWTPLEERGASNSPYSIKNQMSYDISVFDTPVDPHTASSRMEEILHIAKEEYGLLNLTDLVLNHTARDSWLNDHPEAGYSPSNTPHLTPALELDNAIVEFPSMLEEKGLPMHVSTQQDIDTLIDALGEHVRSKNLWQFYVLDVEAEKTALMNAISSNTVTPWTGEDLSGRTVEQLAEIVRSSGLIQGLGTFASRFVAHVDGRVSAGFVSAAFGDLGNDVGALAQAWAGIVNVLNVPLYEEWEDDTRAALGAIQCALKWVHLEDHGPKVGKISKDLPLVETYFTRVAPNCDSDPATYSIANNGWIWDGDPLINFALPPSKAYLRREVVVWADCVKLRFGSRPEDNPWLWEHMTSYATSLARTFDGFRIDNCHSTPLHVGTAMLDAARRVNPNLYVSAELYTPGEEVDLLFVRKLGLNSLMREAVHTRDVEDLSSMMQRCGLGKPLGSMDACMDSLGELSDPLGVGPSRPCIISPLNGSVPHALVYDQTHDNPSYMEKRTAEHALAVSGIVAFGKCAIGSVKGFDDLYPKYVNLNLIKETLSYEITGLEENSGISKAKRVLNGLRREMVLGGYTEGSVWRDFDYITMSRVHPVTGHGYVLVAHTAFEQRGKKRGLSNPLELVRTRAKFLCGFAIDIPSYDIPSDPTLKGLPAKLIDLPEVPVEWKTHSLEPFCSFGPPDFFPPGSIMIFETQLEQVDLGLEEFCMSDTRTAFGGLDLVDLNVVLYRTDGEERDATGGEFGVYDVPDMEALVYCGLEGWMHPLRHIMQNDNQGQDHPLCQCLIQGTGIFDYVVLRLSSQLDTFPNLAAPAQWFRERFDRIKANAPPYLRPKYFAIVITEAYRAARRAAIEQCSQFVSNGCEFTQSLALCAVQMHGMVKSTSLDPGKPTPTLAAGLPHFSAGWGRCWGRDVFISLRGLFLITGNFDGAKKQILAFASTLKHGLIPSLLESGRYPRYNSRDTTWWMLQSIQDYVNLAPNGFSILSEPIRRRFPKDDHWIPWDDPQAYANTSTLADIIQEILQRHASGISFREHNAGPNLDQQMKDNGFNVNIYVDWKTGFMFGGNGDNGGTWMDKMGESVRAGTKGVPPTPRDGAPVEITGLVKSTVRWLDKLSMEGKFPYQGVVASIDNEDTFVTYRRWSDLIQESFEKCFFVPLDPSEDSKYAIDSNIVNRRGIYKDVYGSGPGRERSDYQFRPNFAIAMTVAPELFDEHHALNALQLADKVLRGPLGMKTLDPSDMQYRGVYDNSNDSDDPSIAKGFSYHNGPEWGWPLGYFLRAYLYFDIRAGEGKNNPMDTLHRLHCMLLKSRSHIQTDAWAALPELTNENGAFCRDSCNAQAWSASTMLDFLEEVYKQLP